MSYPKLSRTLGGARSPDRCQRCSGYLWGGGDRWREHDDDDRPTDVVIVLCRACEEIIEPHARLYGRLDRHEHHPGTMGLCQLCRHRDGVTCPLARFNGGPGVETSPPPGRMHLKFSTRRGSGIYLRWSEPKGCSRREVLVIHAEPDHA